MDNSKALPKSLFAFIYHFAKKQWYSFSLMLFVGSIYAILEACKPYFNKLLIDQLVQCTPGLHISLRLLGFPCLGLMLTWLGMEVLDKINRVLSIYVWPTFRKNIRVTLFTYLQGQPHGYFTNCFSGVLSNKLELLPRSCEPILQLFIEHFLHTLITFFMYLGMAIHQVGTSFGIILFGFIISFSLVTWFSIGSIIRGAKVHAEALSTLHGHMVDSLGAMLTVRLFTRSAYELAYLNHYQRNEVKKSIQADWALQKAEFFKGVLNSIFAIVTLVVFIYQWNNHSVSVGDFSFITLTYFNISKTLWHVSRHINQITKAIGAARSALTLLNEPCAIQEVPDEKPLSLTKGSITFKQVSFRYMENMPIFDQLSVHIVGGEKVGLVGRSGSGKTTFVNLILRLYDPQGGVILIDDQEIKKITALHEHISVIQQDPILFHRTIYENIRYGRLDATEAEVGYAAKLAHCDTFIKPLQEGWHTVVGERGVNLSGGQRQRIAIARSILKNAPILIMDEATSSLDSVTEDLILKNLQPIIKDRTTLVVAHRLSTLRGMDRILVFHKGTIVEDGNVAELLAKKGHFTQLWEKQVNGLLPE